MPRDPYKIHRRLGRWRIPQTFREDFREAMMQIQEKVLILEATYEWWDDSIAFVGQCEDFEIVEQGGTVPWYAPGFDVFHQAMGTPARIVFKDFKPRTIDLQTVIIDHHQQ